MELAQHIALGPFVLQARIGSGAMGQVWRGTHAAQGVHVAVKIMTAAGARNDDYLAAFAQEVRAVARLDHPGIIRVFDHGRMGADAPEALGAGLPYLVMEYVGGGALDGLVVSDWAQLRDVLQALLDALAHAHARGVVHRDLKPANVLVRRSADGQPRSIKLTDFGIAHAVDDAQGANEFGTGAYGTPQYMAPEQIHGQWRDQGPWTDLYALGCLAWRLAAGHAPFGGDGSQMAMVIRGHLFDEPPALEPRVVVPRAFEDWLRRLLRKRPAQRYQRAADAAHDLRQLSLSAGTLAPCGAAADVDDDGEAVATIVSSGALVGAVAATRGVTTAASRVLETGQTPASTSAGATQPGLHAEAAAVLEGRVCPPAAPLPETFRRTEGPAVSMPLVGAGLSLFGLRPVPFVNRDAERELIWGLLRRTANARCVHALLIDGAAGTGKTRLVEWLTERAHEVGAAHVLKATHSAIPGPADGVARMVQNFLRCVGMSREDVEQRLDEWLVERPLPGARGVLKEGARRPEDLDACDALVELMLPTADGDGDDGPGRAVRFSSPAERYAVVRGLLERVSRERPVVVWLDDVQWGSDSLGFAAWLLEARESVRLPVLLLLTARDAALTERPVEAAQLEDLLGLEGTQRLSLRSLDHEAHTELVRQLLGLSSALVREVAERTSGHPLFAVHLVGDWVQRGLLRVGPEGFELQPGATVALPDDIHQVWLTRIERAIAGLSTSDGGTAVYRALELAAALGTDIDDAEWRACCGLAGIEVPGGLAEALARGRLADIASAQTWSLSHGMLRESLERSAREQGRWASHNRVCARMLEPRHRDGEAGVAERLGRHLGEAGELEAALEPLYAAAQERARTADFRLAHALFDEHDRMLERLGVAPDDERATRAVVRRADLCMAQGRLEAAEALLDQVEPRVRAQARDAEIAHCLWIRGMVASRKGDVREGAGFVRQSRELWAGCGERAMEGYALCGLGMMHTASGQLEAAIEAYEEALAIFTARPQNQGLGQALVGLADARRRSGQLEQALELTEQALAHRTRTGDRLGVTRCLNMLGEIARARGRLDEAQGYYEKSLTLLRALGAREATIVRINLGIVQVARGELAPAGRELRTALSELERAGRYGFTAVVHALLLPCVASMAQWEAFDDCLAQACTGLAASGMVDEDIARHAFVAAQHCTASAQPARARRALELARAQWHALGAGERLVEVEAELVRLGADGAAEP